MRIRNRIYAVLGRLFIAVLLLGWVSTWIEDRQLALFEESMRQQSAGVSLSEEFRREVDIANFADRFFAVAVGLPVCLVVIVLGIRDVRRDR